MKEILISLLLLLIVFSACEDKKTEETKVSIPDSQPGQATLFKGMCSVTDTMTLTECSTKKHFQIAPSGNIDQLVKVLNMVRSNPQKKNFYIEAEGFTSYTESENNYDTLLVVTRFTRYDTSYSCLK